VLVPLSPHSHLVHTHPSLPIHTSFTPPPQAAEAAKAELCSSLSAPVSLPFITADGTSTSVISVQLRDQFGNNMNSLMPAASVTLAADEGSFLDSMQNMG